jgi:hypothetical protein
MIYILEMSTDPDILATPMHPNETRPQTRCSWDQVRAGNLGIAGGEIVVVVAHGNDKEIGNKRRGRIDINAARFIQLIQGCMQANQVPAEIYISTCEEEYAGFTARVRMLCSQNQLWGQTRLFGHNTPEGGAIPPPDPLQLVWTEIT